MIFEGKNRKPKRRRKSLASRTKDTPRSAYPKGRIIRASARVFDHLRRKLRKGESWDQFLRRHLNIPQRDGSGADLLEVWFLPTTGETFPTKALARGKAVRNGVLGGNLGKFEEPRKMREVV